MRCCLKEKSGQRIRELVARAETAPQPDAQIQFLLVKLRKQLDKHSGKKVYGYLPKSIKATVNEIVAVLSNEPAIAELYSEWNKVNREKLSLYYENKDPTVPLVDNKEFRSIKNMIIKAVMEMPPEIEQGASRNTMATAGGMIGSLARLIGGKCMEHRQRLQGQIDSKLQAKINEKKQALGLRTERTQKPSYQTQDEYDMSM